MCSRHFPQVPHQGHPGHMGRGCPGIAWPGTSPKVQHWEMDRGTCHEAQVPPLKMHPALEDREYTCCFILVSLCSVLDKVEKPKMLWKYRLWPYRESSHEGREKTDMFCKRVSFCKENGCLSLFPAFEEVQISFKEKCWWIFFFSFYNFFLLYVERPGDFCLFQYSSTSRCAGFAKGQVRAGVNCCWSHTLRVTGFQRWQGTWPPCVWGMA